MSDIKDKVLEMLVAPMKSAFEKEGITPEYLAKKLKKELNAKKIETFKGTVVNVVPSDDPDEPDMIESDEVIYSKPMVAWDVRQKARQDAHKLLNHYPPEKREYSGPDGSPMSVDIRPIQVQFVKPNTEEKKESK